MKLVLLLSVSALVVVLTAGQTIAPREANCEKYPTDMCTRELMEVCGDDGNTYSNECMLCVTSRNTNRFIMVLKDGRCDE